jgi:hypothetical protein
LFELASSHRPKLTPFLLPSALPLDGLAKQPFDEKVAIRTYVELIKALPIPNKYLLLYVLDLLSVFEKKSEKNLMTANSTSPFSHRRGIC